MVASRSQRSQTALTPSQLLGRHDGQHPLLALADHDLPGLHVGFAQRHAVGVEVDAHLAFGRHLAGRGGDAGRAQVLQRHQQVGAQQLQTGFQQLLLRERVAHLHRRPLLLQGLVEHLAGQDAGPADAVAARLGPDQHDVVAHPGRLAADDLVVPHQPHGHGVDQAVAGVRVFEVDLAGHGGDAHAVAVAADAGDHMLEQVALAVEGGLADRRVLSRGGRGGSARRAGGASGRGVPADAAAASAAAAPSRRQRLDLAEPQGVQSADGPRPHGEDVADDAAHARWPLPGRAPPPRDGCGSRSSSPPPLPRRCPRSRRSRPDPAAPAPPSWGSV